MTIICASCKKPCEGHKHTNAGWLCRSCVLSASTVLALYIIDGVTYVEKLKTPAVLAAVPVERERQAVAR
ncbi:MAG TPA: hypothetical protein PLB01_00105 [Thermoanaerobaculia bacterium]|nr:hypothetical protein [Thermoanaerobaculia bacterium]